MFFRLGSRRRHWARRLVSLCVLGSVCASFFPLPIGSQPLAEKDRSAPFPCRDRPCGCRSAEQCWKRCCCFSNSEKLAWAKANAVSAPGYVAQAAANEVGNHDCHSRGCSTKVHTAPGSKSGRTPAPESNRSKNSNTVYVLGFLAQQCQGEGLFWNSLPWAVVPDSASFVWIVRQEPWEAPPSPQPVDYSVEPPEPPPRADAPSFVA